jgi:hypothetical protein
MQTARRPASRAALTAGRSIPANMPIIEITTRSSTSVKPTGEEQKRGENLPETSLENRLFLFSAFNSSL